MKASLLGLAYTAQKMKFSIECFFSKCDQIRNFLWIWPYLLKKSLMENFIFLQRYKSSEHSQPWQKYLSNMSKILKTLKMSNMSTSPLFACLLTTQRFHNSI